MTRFTLTAAVLALVAATATAAAQTGDDFHYRADRQIVVVQNGHVLLQEGSWSASNPLRQFANARASQNGGNFILFHDADGVIHSFADAKQLAELDAIYAPMRALDQQQQALSQEQRPLSAQQHTLAEQQHAAAVASNYAEQGAIGREQGKLGQLQGELGRQQGVIGKQQGQIGRAFYARMQQVLDACLKNNTCPAVGNVRDMASAK